MRRCWRRTSCSGHCPRRPTALLHRRRFQLPARSLLSRSGSADAPANSAHQVTYPIPVIEWSSPAPTLPRHPNRSIGHRGCQSATRATSSAWLRRSLTERTALLIRARAGHIAAAVAHSRRRPFTTIGGGAGPAVCPPLPRCQLSAPAWLEDRQNCHLAGDPAQRRRAWPRVGSTTARCSRRGPLYWPAGPATRARPERNGGGDRAGTADRRRDIRRRIRDRRGPRRSRSRGVPRTARRRRTPATAASVAGPDRTSGPGIGTRERIPRAGRATVGRPAALARRGGGRGQRIAAPIRCGRRAGFARSRRRVPPTPPAPGRTRDRPLSLPAR